MAGSDPYCNQPHNCYSVAYNMESVDDADPSPLPTVVFFSNTSEDVWPFIKRIDDQVARESEISENAALSDRDLFALAEFKRLVFITPQAVDPDYLEYYQTLFGQREIEVLVPKIHTGQLCEDAQNDKAVWHRLRELSKQGPLIALSYSSSVWFQGLVNRLRQSNIQIEAPQSPDREDNWVVNFFGSKTGIRQMVQQLSHTEPAALMSTGFIVSGVTNGTNLATARHLLNHGVVLKTQKGHAGLGVVILRPDDLPHQQEAAREKIMDILTNDDYWSDFPMVVEDYIPANPKIAGGFPSAEFRIEPDGQVTFLYVCGMRVTSGGTFQGTEIYANAVPKEMLDKMIRIGRALGGEYARYGYRGYFDIDFIVGQDGNLYVTESNVRRTGGTHVYHAARSLLGADFLNKAYIVSNNVWPLPGKKARNFATLRQELQSLEYDPATQTGLVLCGGNLLAQNKMAYIIFAHDQQQARAIEEKMRQLLS